MCLTSNEKESPEVPNIKQGSLPVKPGYCPKCHLRLPSEARVEEREDELEFERIGQEFDQALREADVLAQALLHSQGDIFAFEEEPESEEADDDDEPQMNGSSGAAAYRSEDEFEDFTARSAGNAGMGLVQQKVDHASYPYTTTAASGSQTLPTSGHRPGASGNICCLLDTGMRCQRTAGNASYSKRVQKTVFYKRLRLDVDNTTQHTYICDHHKNMIQTARVRAKDSDEEGTENQDEGPDVDLYQLQVNTLRRYKKHFKISTRPGLNKAQLADILTKHFKTIPVNEKEIITYFIYTVKSGRNKLDSNNPQQTSGSAPKEDYLDRY